MDATCITPFDVEGNAWNWDWPDPDDIPVGGLPDDHPLIQHQQALERAADEGDRQSAETDAYYARLYEEAKKHLPGDEYTTRLFSLSWSEIRDTRRTLEAVARATEIWAQRNDPDYGRQLSGRRCGTVSAYNAGCRCDACKRGKREAKRAQRARQMRVEEGAKRALERARRKPLPPRERVRHGAGVALSHPGASNPHGCGSERACCPTCLRQVVTNDVLDRTYAQCIVRIANGFRRRVTRSRRTGYRLFVGVVMEERLERLLLEHGGLCAVSEVESFLG